MPNGIGTCIKVLYFYSYSGYELKHRKKYYDRERRWDINDRMAEQAEIEMQTKMAEESITNSNTVDASDLKQPFSTVIKSDPGQWTVADTKETEYENGECLGHNIPIVL